MGSSRDIPVSKVGETKGRQAGRRQIALKPLLEPNAWSETRGYSGINSPCVLIRRFLRNGIDSFQAVYHSSSCMPLLSYNASACGAKPRRIVFSVMERGSRNCSR